jgi:hypothetical protein
MPSTINTSQDPEYEGLPYHEKKFHKTHFEVHKTWSGTHPKDDPDWEYVGVGRWRHKPIETRKRRKRAEVHSGISGK